MEVTMSDSFLDSVFAEVKYATLLYGVRKRIFCPTCRTIMDVSRAVEMTAMNGDDVLHVFHVCSDCFDEHFKYSDLFKVTIEDLGKTVDSVEILDGRDADWDKIGPAMGLV